MLLPSRSGIWVEFQSVLFAFPVHPTFPGGTGAAKELRALAAARTRLLQIQAGPPLSDLGHRRLTLFKSPWPCRLPFSALAPAFRGKTLRL